MLFDSTFHVVGNIGSDNDAVLSAAVHSLGINVVMLFFVLNQPPFFLEHFEIGNSLVIDFRVVFVGAGLEVDFRLDDVIERFLVTLGFFAGFLAAEHIVGARCNLSN